MHEFHPSSLGHGETFRERLRYQHGFHEDTTSRLDNAQKIIESALQKHGGTALTSENFREVMEHAHKDPRWGHLYSGGQALETGIREHLGIKEPHDAR